jgi:hypothetical protein
MEPQVISVARDFSTKPFGRFVADGPFSGERFRNEFLVPALKSRGNVLIDMDGTLGYGSSWLEESFGGLVRKRHFSAAQLHDHLNIQCLTRPSYVRRVWQFIDEARPE